jgi:hypothetical protein
MSGDYHPQLMAQMRARGFQLENTGHHFGVFIGAYGDVELWASFGNTIKEFMISVHIDGYEEDHEIIESTNLIDVLEFVDDSIATWWRGFPVGFRDN